MAWYLSSSLDYETKNLLKLTNEMTLWDSKAAVLNTEMKNIMNTETDLHLQVKSSLNVSDLKRK